MDFAVADFRSWRLDELDFGFGSPKAFKSGPSHLSGVATIYPNIRAGKENEEVLEVLLALEQASMERVLQDRELAEYATPKGHAEESATFPHRRYQLSS
jgi:hypothetical protein